MKNINTKLLLGFAAFCCLTLTGCDTQSSCCNGNGKGKKKSLFGGNRSKSNCCKKSRCNNNNTCATCDCGDSACFSQSCRSRPDNCNR